VGEVLAPWMSAPVRATMDDIVDMCLPVLITDDNLKFRRALADVLGASSHFTIVGETASGEEAIEMVGRLRPALVVMDLNMPEGMDGIEATRKVHDRWPAAAVVIVSTARPGEVPPEVGTCGALGYLPKDELTPEALFNLWALHQQPSEPA